LKKGGNKTGRRVGQSKARSKYRKQGVLEMGNNEAGRGEVVRLALPWFVVGLEEQRETFGQASNHLGLSLKTYAFQVLIRGLTSALLITRIVPVPMRSVWIAAVVGRRRRRWNVLGHASGTARHHGKITPILQHRHLRVLSHDLQKTFLAFFFLLALPGFDSLAAFALALLDLLDLTSRQC
jgi:hypothetical protein